MSNLLYKYFCAQKDASALLLPPTRATHGRCVLCHLCRELWRGVHKCARLCFGCARCARCVRNVVGPDGGFQRVFCEVCAHLQNVSDSVAELDAPRNPFDDSDELCAGSGKTAPERISAWGAKASPGAEIRELFRPEGKVATFPGAPGAVRGRIWRFGQIWRPGGYSN